jgi:hypothetical protein
MLLHTRPIAVSAAILCFFGLSFVCWSCGHPPSTCCSRSFIGAVLAYFVTALVVRAINAILTSALISDYLDQLKGKDRAAGN